jgi:hypothetical protein
VKSVVPALDETASAADDVGARDRFRAFLSAHATTAHALRYYIDEALPAFSDDSQVRLAIEELVDHAGRLLGFSVAREKEWTWSVWRSPGKARLIVRVDTAAGAAAGLGQFARQRDIVALAEGDSPLERPTGLIVVCGELQPRLLEDAVVVRRAADYMRLVTIDALVTLVTRARAGNASHADAATILRPAGAFVDSLVGLFDVRS